MRVKWLRNAAADLDAEAAYIAQEDPGLAMKMYAYIRDRVETLGEFPESGRPGRVFGTRELVLEHYRYIVPYRVKDGAVEVLRVFHTRRKPPKNW